MRFSISGLLRAVMAAAAVLFSAQSPASADPWTREKGHGQVHTTVYATDSARGFDDSGKVVDIPDYTKTEAYLLVEFGLTDNLTLIATPSFRAVSVENGDDTQGLGYTDLGARYRIASKDNWVLSVQGLLRVPGKRRRDSLAQVGSTDAEYEARVLVGRSFKIGNTDAFLDVQGAYRAREGAPPDEGKADLTLGARPRSDWLVMAQLFNTFSLGQGQSGFPQYRYHNFQLSVTKDLASNLSLQLGGMMTLDGRNALRERGLLTGLWFRF